MCDLRDIIGDVSETAGILGESAGIAVTSEMPSTPVRMAVDRHRIREMLLNLVTNAIKYTQPGGTVALGLSLEDGSVVFTVSDTGIGIAPGDLPHIFDRFWRADPARSRTGDRPGTGFGSRDHQVDRGGARGVDHGAEPAGAGIALHGSAAPRGRPGAGRAGRGGAELGRVGSGNVGVFSRSHVLLTVPRLRDRGVIRSTLTSGTPGARPASGRLLLRWRMTRS